MVSFCINFVLRAATPHPPFSFPRKKTGGVTVQKKGVCIVCQFGGIEVSIADSWWVNPMSEVCSLLAYICLIGFFIRATKK